VKENNTTGRMLTKWQPEGKPQMNAEDADKSKRRGWLRMATTTLHRIRNSFHPRSLRSSAVYLFLDNSGQQKASEAGGGAPREMG